MNLDKPQFSTALTPLSVAAYYGNFECTKLLVENGANVNHKSKQQMTPIYLAARKQQYNIVQYLCSISGVLDFMIKSTDNNAFLYAINNNEPELVKIFLAYEVDPEITGTAGEIPLNIATRKNYEEIVEILCIYINNYDPESPVDFLTPFMFAVLSGFFGVADILLQLGADVHCKDHQNHTISEIALRTENRLALKYLKKRKIWDGNQECLQRDSYLKLSKEKGRLAKRDSLMHLTLTFGPTGMGKMKEEKRADRPIPKLKKLSPVSLVKPTYKKEESKPTIDTTNILNTSKNNSKTNTPINSNYDSMSNTNDYKFDTSFSSTEKSLFSEHSDNHFSPDSSFENVGEVPEHNEHKEEKYILPITNTKKKNKGKEEIIMITKSNGSKSQVNEAFAQGKTKEKKLRQGKEKKKKSNPIRVSQFASQKKVGLNSSDNSESSSNESHDDTQTQKTKNQTRKKSSNNQISESSSPKEFNNHTQVSNKIKKIIKKEDEQNIIDLNKPEIQIALTNVKDKKKIEASAKTTKTNIIENKGIPELKITTKKGHQRYQSMPEKELIIPTKEQLEIPLKNTPNRKKSSNISIEEVAEKSKITEKKRIKKKLGKIMINTEMLDIENLKEILNELAQEKEKCATKTKTNNNNNNNNKSKINAEIRVTNDVKHRERKPPEENKNNNKKHVKQPLILEKCPTVQTLGQIIKNGKHNRVNSLDPQLEIFNNMQNMNITEVDKKRRVQNVEKNLTINILPDVEKKNNTLVIDKKNKFKGNNKGIAQSLLNTPANQLFAAENERVGGAKSTKPTNKKQLAEIENDRIQNNQTTKLQNTHFNLYEKSKKREDLDLSDGGDASKMNFRKNKVENQGIASKYKMKGRTQNDNVKLLIYPNKTNKRVAERKKENIHKTEGSKSKLSSESSTDQTQNTLIEKGIKYTLVPSHTKKKSSRQHYSSSSSSESNSSSSSSSESSSYQKAHYGKYHRNHENRDHHSHNRKHSKHKKHFKYSNSIKNSNILLAADSESNSEEKENKKQMKKSLAKAMRKTSQNILDSLTGKPAEKKYLMTEEVEDYKRHKHTDIGVRKYQNVLEPKKKGSDLDRNALQRLNSIAVKLTRLKEERKGNKEEGPDAGGRTKTGLRYSKLNIELPKNLRMPKKSKFQ